VQSVRGYLEAEELGDIGAKASFQLGSPQWKLFADHLHLDSFLFYDFARVSTLDPLSGEPSSSELRSLGAGFNFSAFSHLGGNLTWAYPLTTASRTREHSSRLLFSIQSMW
jgi:hemolysin activation/secretion protein